jgi:hypothetical protein
MIAKNNNSSRNMGKAISAVKFDVSSTEEAPRKSAFYAPDA